MATITFISSAEASKFSNAKPSAFEDVPTEVECVEEEDHYDMYEYSFFEATPVSVSEIPEDIGLTLKDLFLDDSSDDDIQVVDEKISTIPGLSTTYFEKSRTSVKSTSRESEQNIEKYITMTKDNPHITISRATYEQMLNVKPSKKLELKDKKLTNLLDNAHKAMNMLPSVVIKRLYVQPSQTSYQVINEYEVKTEPADLSISEDVVDDQFFKTWVRDSFTSSDEESFEGFNSKKVNSSERSYRLRYILKSLLQEQTDIISEVREFRLPSIFGMEYANRNCLSTASKICKFCKKENYQNDVDCNCRRTYGNSISNNENPVRRKNYKCAFCDYSVEDLKILDQHYMIHGKFPKIILKNFKNGANVIKTENIKLSTLKNSRWTKVKRSNNANKVPPESYKACIFCECKYAYTRILQNHYLKKHKNYHCAYCSKNLKIKSNLTKHLIQKHLVKSHACKYCSFTTFDWKLARFHESHKHGK